jgi:hypothetical protein
MTTPMRRSKRCSMATRSLSADPSGSTGSSSTVPGAVLLESTPAAAATIPSRFSTMRVTPPGCVRVATTRTVSSVIACSRSSAWMMRPSAFDTILLVTAMMSPSASNPSRASPIMVPRSAPGVISGMPATA